jgi:hypothetical protein
LSSQRLLIENLKVHTLVGSKKNEAKLPVLMYLGRFDEPDLLFLFDN